MMAFERIHSQPTVIPLLTVMTMIRNVHANGLDLCLNERECADRPREWYDRIVLSVMAGFPLGMMLVLHLAGANGVNARQECVDGRHRLLALYRFVEEGCALGEGASCEAMRLAGVSYDGVGVCTMQSGDDGAVRAWAAGLRAHHLL